MGKIVTAMRKTQKSKLYKCKFLLQWEISNREFSGGFSGKFFNTGCQFCFCLNMTSLTVLGQLNVTKSYVEGGHPKSVLVMEGGGD